MDTIAIAAARVLRVALPCGQECESTAHQAGSWVTSYMYYTYGCIQSAKCMSEFEVVLLHLDLYW